jgi:hypothetical protein
VLVPDPTQKGAFVALKVTRQSKFMPKGKVMIRQRSNLSTGHLLYNKRPNVTVDKYRTTRSVVVPGKLVQAW